MRNLISVDTAKCTGCGICEQICSSSKYKGYNPRTSLIGVVRFSNGELDAALSCQFCEKPTCVRVCPRKALTQDQATGIIFVDENKCTGCGWCASSCEFGAAVMNPTKKVVTICDYCKGKPLCVEYCPPHALEITTHEALSAKKRMETFKSA